MRVHMDTVRRFILPPYFFRQRRQSAAVIKHMAATKIGAPENSIIAAIVSKADTVGVCRGIRSLLSTSKNFELRYQQNNTKIYLCQQLQPTRPYDGTPWRRWYCSGKRFGGSLILLGDQKYEKDHPKMVFIVMLQKELFLHSKDSRRSIPVNGVPQFHPCGWRAPRGRLSVPH